MNWLDLQTKEILWKEYDPKLAPPKTAEFALVLLRKGSDHDRMVRAVSAINQSTTREATALVGQTTPITIHADLTEEDALRAQFSLICSDAISVFLRSEVLEQNDQTYLQPLFERVLHSSEFRLMSAELVQVPMTEMGEQFLWMFFGIRVTNCSFPVSVLVTFKKARLISHWAKRVGAKIELSEGRHLRVPSLEDENGFTTTESSGP